MPPRPPQAFTESNAGALNLKVGSQTADSLQTGVGARASYKAKVGNVTVKPQLSVVWQHEYSDNTRGLNARLAQGSSTMNFRTDQIGRDFAVVSAEVSGEILQKIRGPRRLQRRSGTEQQLQPGGKRRPAI